MDLRALQISVLFTLTVVVPAAAEQATCENLRDNLVSVRERLKPIADKLEDRIGKPGISVSIERMELAKTGRSIAENQVAIVNNLSRSNCLDYLGRDTDWSPLVKRAREILDIYLLYSERH